jgi:hypothetical protein
MFLHISISVWAGVRLIEKLDLDIELVKTEISSIEVIDTIKI